MDEIGKENVIPPKTTGKKRGRKDSFGIDQDNVLLPHERRRGRERRSDRFSGAYEGLDPNPDYTFEDPDAYPTKEEKALHDKRVSLNISVAPKNNLNACQKIFGNTHFTSWKRCTDVLKNNKKKKVQLNQKIQQAKERRRKEIEEEKEKK